MAPPRDARDDRHATLFLWCWSGLIFVFFSVSGGKLPTYVLPCFPPLALLLGREWQDAAGPDTGAPAGSDRRRATAWLTGFLPAMALLLVALAAGYEKLPTSQRWAIAAWLVGALAAGAVLGFLALRRGTARALFVATTLAGVLFTVGLGQGARRYLTSESVVDLAARTVQQAGADTAVISYCATKAPSFRFYLGRAWGDSRRLIDLPPQARPAIFGATDTAEDGSEEATCASALGTLLTHARDGSVICLIRESHFRQILSALATVRCATILDRRGNHLLITNQTGGQ
jgi:hypothetical protein